jgi:hypothetical protein
MCEFPRVLLLRLMKWQTTVCSTVIRYIFFMSFVHTWTLHFLLTICFCATTTSDFDLKLHTNYTSKNIKIIIKISYNTQQVNAQILRL